jgi:hypothetical protein
LPTTTTTGCPGNAEPAELPAKIPAGRTKHLAKADKPEKESITLTSSDGSTVVKKREREKERKREREKERKREREKERKREREKERKREREKERKREREKERKREREKERKRK